MNHLTRYKKVITFCDYNVITGDLFSERRFDICGMKKSIPVAKPTGRMVTTESGEVFKIERNIPMSGSFRSLGANLKYPFSKMEVGESFEMKFNAGEIRKRVSNISSACTSYVKANNKSAKFTVRRTSPTTVRVWRLK